MHATGSPDGAIDITCGFGLRIYERLHYSQRLQYIFVSPRVAVLVHAAEKSQV